MNYFSVKQVAKKFGVHPTTVWRWVKSSDFPKPVNLSPGCTRWTEKSIQDWEAKRAGV